MVRVNREIRALKNGRRNLNVEGPRPMRGAMSTDYEEMKVYSVAVFGSIRELLP